MGMKVRRRRMRFGILGGGILKGVVCSRLQVELLVFD